MSQKFRYIKNGVEYFGEPDATSGTKYHARNTLGNMEWMEYSKLASSGAACLSTGDLGLGYQGGSPLTYRDVVLNDGPVGYWRLDEPSGTTATDSVGSNTGTSQTGVTVNVGGISPDNSAYLFDGAQGKVAFSNPGFTTAFSLEAWVYILGSGTVGGTDYSCVFGIDGTHRMLLRNTTGEVLCQMGGGNVTAPVGSFSLEQWTHIVYTRNGNNQNFYINGVNVGTLSQAGASFNAAFFLGSYAATSLNYSFYGRMDEVAIYNKELTPAQIQSHYNSKPAASAISGISELAPFATNASSTLTIDTPDHSGQVVEPCIEYVPAGWNGHKWFGFITGYTNGNNATENPSFYYSDDGLNFTPFPGAPYPVVSVPAQGNNADPEIRLGPDGVMRGFYITFGDPANFTSVWEVHSSDGSTWSSRALLFQSTSISEQATGPVTLYDPDNGRWVMWYVDAHTQGQGGAVFPIKRRTCNGTDPTGTWSGATTCTVTGLPNGRSPFEAHIERYGDQLHMITTLCDNGTGGSNTTLHFGVSNDHGLTWNINPTPLLSASASGWDNGVVYRGDIGPLLQGETGLYGLWYSGRNASTTWRWGRTVIKI